LSSLTGRLDSLFSDTATNLAGVWSDFFDSVSALSSNAGGTAERQNLLKEASTLAARFRQLDGQLRSLDSEVNNGLVTGASEVNRLVAQVVGYTGGTAVMADGGPINGFTAGGQPLVVGMEASTLTTVADPYRPERLQLALKGGGTTTLLDQRALGGRIGGLVEFR